MQQMMLQDMCPVGALRRVRLVPTREHPSSRPECCGEGPYINIYILICAVGLGRRCRHASPTAGSLYAPGFFSPSLFTCAGHSRFYTLLRHHAALDASRGGLGPPGAGPGPLCNPQRAGPDLVAAQRRFSRYGPARPWAGSGRSRCVVIPELARNCITINPCQQDATLIRDAEIKANIANECGRTEIGGNIDIGESTEKAIAANAVTEIKPGSEVVVTLHQVNADGAGPYECDLEEDGNTGTKFTVGDAPRALGRAAG